MSNESIGSVIVFFVIRVGSEPTVKCRKPFLKYPRKFLLKYFITEKCFVQKCFLENGDSLNNLVTKNFYLKHLNFYFMVKMCLFFCGREEGDKTNALSHFLPVVFFQVFPLGKFGLNIYV